VWILIMIITKALMQLIYSHSDSLVITTLLMMPYIARLTGSWHKKLWISFAIAGKQTIIVGGYTHG
jgi:hypothetical protein